MQGDINPFEDAVGALVPACRSEHPDLTGG
jgi:hypothetical protein